MALETHAMTCSECADALRNGRPVDTALRGAFASLRERRTIIAPGRVRLAVGLTTATPSRWLLAPRFFGRLTEVSVMLAVTVFAVGSSLEPSTRPSSSLAPPYIRSRSSKRRAAHLADLSPRGAISLALVVLALVNACATAPPTRRDVVIGLVGEPRSVFDDDPSARFIASAVTETLVRRDAHDELIPRLAESVPTLENAGLRVVTD
ncbi:MAG: hypothetical protein E6J15_02570, partial [Chloroflexi bacterium]